ncbi:MAG TPA: hypothetical protein VFN71_06990 [Methylomirabilota bacterium]|nr:hypothetical protein [Methylomirabilota bacterium]
MFSGGDYEEVARWLSNFALSHAKRETLSAEAVLDGQGPREGRSYGLRIRVGDRVAPPEDLEPLELPYAEVAGRRGEMAWCQALASRVRALARQAAESDRTRLSA